MLKELLSRSGISRFAAVDLETTGLEADCEIVEIGIAVFEDGELVAQFSELVRPEKDFPLRIQKLTGIRERDVKKARQLAEVLPEALDMLGDLPLVAHNLDFDRGFLERWAVRLGLPWQASPLSLDTVPLARILFPTLPGHRLADLSTFFGLAHDRAHRAYDDALADGQALLKMLRAALGLKLPLLRRLAALCQGSGEAYEPLFQRLLELQSEQPGPGDWEEFQPPSRSHVYLREASAHGLPLRFDSGEWFGEAGRLKRSLDEFRPRQAQQDMAAEVWDCLSEEPPEGHPAVLSVEAATGTGKSFAYLLPAMLRGHRSRQAGGGPVLISTYTRNLQDQHFEKDIPLLGTQLEQGLKAVLLKGRGNYLCGQRLEQVADEAPRRLSMRERLELMPLLTWAQITRNGDIEECTGFRSRYQQGLWQAVRSESTTCRGSTCRGAGNDQGQVCWAAHSRREAQDAHLLVVNHSLLLSDLDVEHGVLGAYESLILDEAHHLVKAAEGQLKKSFSPQLLEIRLRQVYDPGSQGRGHLRRLLDNLGGRGAAGGEELFRLLEDAARALRDLLPHVEQLRSGLNNLLIDRHRDAMATRRFTQKERIRQENHPLRSLRAEAEPCLTGLKSLCGLLNRLTEAWRSTSSEPERSADLEALCAHLADDAHELDLLVEESWGQEAVVWSELHPGNEEASFHRVDLNLGAQLSSTCWKQLSHLVLCSATLRVDDSFRYLHHRLGLDLLDPPPLERVFASPFQLERQARFLIPGWFPEASGRNQQAFATELAGLVDTLSRRYQRGTLLLFTSYGLLNACYTALLARVDTRQQPLFGQGLDGSRHELLERFRQEPGAILLGTDSFWQGVDLPGEALQILVMTKLPFDVPGEPLIEARGEQIQREGGHPFGDLAVPEAIIRFRQGFGRLIRHEDDRGVFLLLDHRVIHKQYGHRFLDALPLPHSGCFREEDLLKKMDSMFRKR